MTFFPICMRTSSVVGESEAIQKWEMDGNGVPVSVRDSGMRYQCFSFDSAATLVSFPVL